MNRARSKRESIRHFSDRMSDALPEIPADLYSRPAPETRRDDDAAEDRLAPADSLSATPSSAAGTATALDGADPA